MRKLQKIDDFPKYHYLQWTNRAGFDSLFFVWHWGLPEDIAVLTLTMRKCADFFVSNLLICRSRRTTRWERRRHSILRQRQPRRQQPRQQLRQQLLSAPRPCRCSFCSKRQRKISSAAKRGSIGWASLQFRVYDRKRSEKMTMRRPEWLLSEACSAQDSRNFSIDEDQALDSGTLFQTPNWKVLGGVNNVCSTHVRIIRPNRIQTQTGPSVKACLSKLRFSKKWSYWVLDAEITLDIFARNISQFMTQVAGLPSTVIICVHGISELHALIPRL